MAKERLAERTEGVEKGAEKLKTIFSKLFESSGNIVAPNITPQLFKANVRT